jgi:hypothetical protein
LTIKYSFVIYINIKLIANKIILMTKIYYLITLLILLSSCNVNHYKDKQIEQEYKERNSEDRFDKLYKELD